MPVIRPSSDLRNGYNEISEYCHAYAEPVYITKNGRGDLVVLSIEAYEKLVGKYELYHLLEKGFAEIEAGEVYDAHDVFAEIEENL